MTAGPLPPPTVVDGSAGETVSWSNHRTRLLVRAGTRPAVTVELQRCAHGRLRRSYPVGAHDVELRVLERLAEGHVTAVLEMVVGAVCAADPSCRKIVFAVERDVAQVNSARVLAEVAAAESAGFRYVVDVDLPEAELILLVWEPDWVTNADPNLEHVPGT